MRHFFNRLFILLTLITFTTASAHTIYYSEDFSSQSRSVEKNNIVEQYFIFDNPVIGGVCLQDHQCERYGVPLTNYSMLPLSGWERTTTDGGCAAGVYAVGSGAFLGGVDYIVPSTTKDGSTEGNVLGLIASWGITAQYKQASTLPSGNYSLKISYYNAGGTTRIKKNLIGFIADDGTEYLDSIISFPMGKWITEEINFTLAETTTGYFTMGYNSPGVASPNVPHLFIDITLNSENTLDPSNGGVSSDNIVFEDSIVKSLCVENWDTNGDGELSYEEAAAVTELNYVFEENRDITSFNEFQYFTNLTDISDAFYACMSLSSITIPSSVTCIKGTFSFTGLSSITIPSSITSIGSDAFSYCSSLSSISIPEGVTSIGDGAFSYCYSLSSITIPSSVTSIGDFAFCNCSSLSSITIPTSVTKIGEYSFSGCSSLSSITIPKGVTSIGDNAFSGCDSLSSITIPSSVTSICDYAFYVCENLSTVVLYNNNPFVFGKNAFSYISSDCVLYVPKGTRNAYIAAGWTESVFKGGIVEMDNPDVKNYNIVLVTPTNGILEADKTSASKDETVILTVTPDVGYEVESVRATYYEQIGSSDEYVTKDVKLESLSEGTEVDIQKDVTDLYITNADMASSTGWNRYISNSYREIGNGLIGSFTVRDNMSSATDETHLSSEYCFGFECRWSGNYASYNQTINNLPAGVYQLTYDVQNMNRSTNNASYDNLFYVMVGDTIYSDSSTEWMKGSSGWTPHTITFTLEEESAVTISLGYGSGGNNINASLTPALYVSHLKLSNLSSQEVVGYVSNGYKFIMPDADVTIQAFFREINPLDADEWESLQNVYAQLSGMGWSQPWDMSVGKNRAYLLNGVKVEDGHISSLDLSNQGLTGSFPNSVLQFPYLQKLNMADNSLNGDISQAAQGNFPAKASLQELNISGNQLTGNIGAFAEGLTNLTTLDASSNKIDAVSPMIPATVTMLNICRQTISTVIQLHLAVLDEKLISEVVPDIMRYDHKNHSFVDDLSLQLRQSEFDRTIWLSYTDGTVALTLPASDNVYYGQSGDILTASLTDNSGSSAGSTFQISLSFDKGDSNFDGAVNVLDLQTIINYMFEEIGTNPFNHTAANLWVDEIINVQDAVCLVNLLLADEGNGSGKRRKKRSFSEGSYDNGDATLFIDNGQLRINTTMPVSAFDIMVADCQQTEMSDELKALGFTCAIRQTADGGSHIVGYSLSGEELPAGTLSICRLTGGEVQSAMLADRQAREISVTLNGSATSVTKVDDKRPVKEIKRIHLDSRHIIIVDENGNKILIKDE